MIEPKGPTSESYTSPLPPRIAGGPPQTTVALVEAEPAARELESARVCAGQLIVAVLVWLELAGAAEYEQL